MDPRLFEGTGIDPNESFSGQLKFLHGMGFTDLDTNRRALAASGGKVQESIEYIVSGNIPDRSAEDTSLATQVPVSGPLKRALKELNSRGFTDEAANREALSANGMDVDKAMVYLIRMRDGSSAVEDLLGTSPSKSAGGSNRGGGSSSGSSSSGGGRLFGKKKSSVMSKTPSNSNMGMSESARALQDMFGSSGSPWDKSSSSTSGGFLSPPSQSPTGSRRGSQSDRGVPLSGREGRLSSGGYNSLSGTGGSGGSSGGPFSMGRRTSAAGGGRGSSSGVGGGSSSSGGGGGGGGGSAHPRPSTPVNTEGFASVEQLQLSGLLPADLAAIGDENADTAHPVFVAAPFVASEPPRTSQRSSAAGGAAPPLPPRGAEPGLDAGQTDDAFVYNPALLNEPFSLTSASYFDFSAPTAAAASSSGASGPSQRQAAYLAKVSAIMEPRDAETATTASSEDGFGDGPFGNGAKDGGDPFADPFGDDNAVFS